MSIDLNAPEVQEAIQAAVEEATSKLKEESAKLHKENAKWRVMARGKSEIDPEEFERLQRELEDVSAKFTEAQKAAKKATTEAETARKQLQDAEGFTQRLLVDNGLTDALAKAGVTNPAHLKAVKAMLAGQVQIVADGDQKVAKVGDKALPDFVSEWAKGDEGKFFVSAPNNSGGGAAGGSTGSTKPTGDLGGDKAARVAALAAKFPELNKT